MQTTSANNRQIFYAKAHHEVIEAWASFRRGTDKAPHLITLDRHADLKPAFFQETYRSIQPSTNMSPSQIEHGAATGSSALSSLSVKDVKNSINKLAHDEHIDACRRANIIDKVFLLQSSIDSSNVCWADIKRINVDDVATADAALMPSTLDPFIKEIEASIGSSISNFDYILDIDLDYFYTRRGAQPSDPSSFHRLVRGAALITIALEPSCVREFLLFDRDISAKQLFGMVKNEIANA